MLVVLAFITALGLHPIALLEQSSILAFSVLAERS